MSSPQSFWQPLLFFRKEEKIEVDKAEFSLIFAPLAAGESESKSTVDIQIALRLAFRSKPLHVLCVKNFLEALRYEEPVFLSGRKFCFSLDSFEPSQRKIVQMVLDHAVCSDPAPSERAQRIAELDLEVFGMILAEAFETVHKEKNFSSQEEELIALPGIYENTSENPLKVSFHPAHIQFSLEHIPPPTSKILINPTLLLQNQAISLEEVRFLHCAQPGMLFKGAYYRFSKPVTRLHLRNLKEIRDMTIPEPLFGAFVENALPQMSAFGEIANPEVIEDFVTLPFVGDLSAICRISYLDGELDATLHFNYNGHEIPAAAQLLGVPDVMSFVTKKGVLARNLVEERKIVEELFQDFIFNPETGLYVAKSDKKIVEFMTDVIPRNQHRVHFECPQNLLDQFLYDQTEFTLNLKHTGKIDRYEIELKVDGALRGVRLDQLWECMGAKKNVYRLRFS